MHTMTGDPPSPVGWPTKPLRSLLPLMAWACIDMRADLVRTLVAPVVAADDLRSRRLRHDHRHWTAWGPTSSSRRQEITVALRDSRGVQPVLDRSPAAMAGKKTLDLSGASPTVHPLRSPTREAGKSKRVLQGTRDVRRDAASAFPLRRARFKELDVRRCGAQRQRGVTPR